MRFEPVEAVPGAPDGLTRLLLLCDHASNAVPPGIALGLPGADMARHIAWDVGARGVTLGLAEALGAPAILSTFSRLVIDPNRGEDDPTLVMRLYDGSIIPGNARVDAAEKERRLQTLHRPYHDRIRATLDAMEAEGLAPVIVSIHSFTPQLKGRAWRPWHVGLLWDRDTQLVDPLRDALHRDAEICVGDNEPYTGQLQGDCMWQHGTNRDLPHVLIEVRNDLIETPEGQRDWARRLAPMIHEAVGKVAGAALSA